MKSKTINNPTVPMTSNNEQQKISLEMIIIKFTIFSFLCLSSFYYFFNLDFVISIIYSLSISLIIGILSFLIQMRSKKNVLIAFSSWMVYLMSILIFYKTIQDISLDKAQNIDLEGIIIILALTLAFYLDSILLHVVKNNWKAIGHNFEYLKLPNLISALIFANILCCLTLISCYYFYLDTQNPILDKVINRGIIPPICLLFFYWGFLLLIFRCITIYSEVNRINNNPSQSFLLNQIEQSKKTKNKIDLFMSDLLYKEEQFFIMPSYINWAIPILGFIGTVYGISLATVEIVPVMSGVDNDVTKIVEPLGIAFDTTLIALCLNLILVLFQNVVKKMNNGLIIKLSKFI